MGVEQAAVSGGVSREGAEVARVVPVSGRRGSVPRWLRRAAGPMGLVGVWQVLSAGGALPDEVVASPGAVARTAGGMVSDGTLPSAMGVSLSGSPDGCASAGSGDFAVWVTGLVGEFGGRAVVGGLQLGVRPGEFVALPGRSGCGESTLLRVPAGLDREIRGEVPVPRRKTVAVQAPRLMPFAALKPIPRAYDFGEFVDPRFNGGLPPSSTAPRTYRKAR